MLTDGHEHVAANRRGADTSWKVTVNPAETHPS